MTLALPQVPQTRPNSTTLLPLHNYNKILVQVSGGKDSIDALLNLLDAGADPDKIELWHQHIDGLGVNGLMDWNITESYCRKLAVTLDLPIRFQYRIGGFEREMNRDNALTAPVRFQLNDGQWGEAGGVRGKPNTRKQFPQVSPDLSVRWCSAYLKIDVASVALNNDPALREGNILFVTGERRQESAARARYAEFEQHRCSNKRRRVDHWRNVIDRTEEQVWDRIRRAGIVPHPAYRLGWGRVSCMACIFGDPDQWASLRELDPIRFKRIVAYEQEFGKTIRRNETVTAAANRGKSFLPNDEALIALALGHEYDEDILIDPDKWTLPPGAYRHGGGPS
jgi:3'-phosphoadenosine 5'-phosphosulfate sulfotransferase (PAPS reductase)/FAD synthetase